MFVVQEDAVEVPLEGDAWETKKPDPLDRKAYEASQHRAGKLARTSFQASTDTSGWYTNPEGEKVLAVKSGVKCRRDHDQSWEKTSCARFARALSTQGV